MRDTLGPLLWVQIPPPPPSTEPTPLSELATFAFHLKKNGYRESTIRGTVQALKALTHHVNLLEPESVKAYLANAECSINRKGKVAEDLDRFYRYKGIQLSYASKSAVLMVPLHSMTRLMQMFSFWPLS